MRISSQLCFTISWLGVLVMGVSTYSQDSEDSDNQNIRRDGSAGEGKTAEESRQRFSFERDDFKSFIPPDFEMEISKLRIPVAEDIPRRIEVSREESSREENVSEQDRTENVSEQDGFEGSLENDNEDKDEDDREDEEEEDVPESNRTGEEESDEERREEKPSDYDEYDSPPKNTISYHYDESGEEKPAKKPKKKRPHVEYEVTETIPHDTKTVRPTQKVYPLPPPCPGAPPPTYPTTMAPATKSPPSKPPFPIFPEFSKIFPNSPQSLLSHTDFLDSYFPTSFMSSSSFQNSKFRMPVPGRKQPLKRYTPLGKESKKVHKRVASPRVILRYHEPTAFVIRKIQHGPAPDRVIIRKPLTPAVKEVHIHHHHDTPGKVLHIHKDDDGTALDTAKFKAKVDSQRFDSDRQYESATTGPFAEPPANLRLSGRRTPKTPKVPLLSKS